MMVATTTDLVRYQDSVTGADVELSIAEIKRTMCPKATDQEAANFLQLCRYMGLNPFVRDAYLIKYGDQAASMVVGKDAFCKRADAHPQFAGMESGVIVQTGDKEPIHRKGTLVLKEENIVGGWARVARGDRKLDTDTTVAFSEFSTGRAMWLKMPAVMIEKVAIVKALRTAFPATFSGLYDQAEMGIDLNEDMEPLTGVVDAPEPVVIPAESVEDIIKATQGMIADSSEEAYDEGVIVLDEGDSIEEESAFVAGELVEIVRPENCDKDGHNGAMYEVIKSPSTGDRRWAHSFSYELNGQAKTSWCVYGGAIEVPPEELSQSI
jgi:phage recombination protein Bet